MLPKRDLSQRSGPVRRPRGLTKNQCVFSAKRPSQPSKHLTKGNLMSNIGTLRSITPSDPLAELIGQVRTLKFSANIAIQRDRTGSNANAPSHRAVVTVTEFFVFDLLVCRLGSFTNCFHHRVFDFWGTIYYVWGGLLNAYFWLVVANKLVLHSREMQNLPRKMRSQAYSTHGCRPAPYQIC